MSKTEAVLLCGAFAIGNGALCYVASGALLALLAVAAAAILLIAQVIPTK